MFHGGQHQQRGDRGEPPDTPGVTNGLPRLTGRLQVSRKRAMRNRIKRAMTKNVAIVAGGVAKAVKQYDSISPRLA